jgi:hypothetical protein
MVDLRGTYKISKQWDAEAGYRFWRFDAHNGIQRGGPTFATARPARTLFSERSGLLVGLKYAF